MFVKPTKEGTRFIPTSLATKSGIKKVGVGIIDQLVVADYIGNAADVNNVEGCAVKDELEPSTANILEGKNLATGTDFRSFDPRSLREE